LVSGWRPRSYINQVENPRIEEVHFILIILFLTNVTKNNFKMCCDFMAKALLSAERSLQEVALVTIARSLLQLGKRDRV